jgi:hypothetical protein
MTVLLKTTQKVLAIIEKLGYMPEKVGENPSRVKHNTAYGSPGVIPMLTVASEVFLHMKYRLLEMAEVIGKSAYENSDDLGNNSLREGVVGNAYVLHNLYRTF